MSHIYDLPYVSVIYSKYTVLIIHHLLLLLAANFNLQAIL